MSLKAIWNDSAIVLDPGGSSISKTSSVEMKFPLKSVFWNGNCVRLERLINISSNKPEENNPMIRRALLLPLWVRYFLLIEYKEDKNDRALIARIIQSKLSLFFCVPSFFALCQKSNLQVPICHGVSSNFFFELCPISSFTLHSRVH